MAVVFDYPYRFSVSFLDASNWQVFFGNVILANNKLTAINRLQVTKLTTTKSYQRALADINGH